MEMILFTGIPASGKSFYYKDHFVDTHIRINLDMLKTRHRESLLFEACLAAKQPCVIDNTNLTKLQRSRCISAAKLARFTVVGYYFRSQVDECLARNSQRSPTVPEVAILSASVRLEIPNPDEGYDRIYYVWFPSEGSAITEDWKHEYRAKFAITNVTQRGSDENH